MVGFRHNPIFRQSLLIAPGSPEYDQTSVVVSGSRIELVPHQLVVSRIGFQIQDDDFRPMLLGQGHALPGPGRFENLDPAAFQGGPQHFPRIGRAVDNQDTMGGGGQRGGEHQGHLHMP